MGNDLTQITTLKIQFCAAIEKIACRQGLSQKEVAARTGLTEGYISRIYRRDTAGISLHHLAGCLYKMQPYAEILIAT